MARILIIAEEWPQAAPGAGLLRRAILDAGCDVSVISSAAHRDLCADDMNLIRVPSEPPVSQGRLFALRNALFFDTVANPGNYAMLRDTLHQHLQEVLYDAVLILCPPAIYLKLGYWIDLSFGIPVWVHVSASLKSDGGSAFHRWNHGRLRRKYLAAAKLITVENRADLDSIAVQEYQRGMLATIRKDGLHFVDAANGNSSEMTDILQSVFRRKP